MIFRVLDIETVPDEATWTRGEPTFRIVPSRDSTGGLSVGVSCVDIEPFPPPQACRVVAISTVDLEFDPGSDRKYHLLTCRTDCRWAPGADEDAEEKRLLVDFGELMAGGVGVHLVTWNGRTFDLPVIVVRSLKHRIACGWYYADRDVRYRYSAEKHCDLMDHMADFGASRPMKLGDFVRLVGLPGKTDVCGSDVHAMYLRAGNFPAESGELRARVARYCLQDTVQTAVAFIATRHLAGKLSPATHDAAVESFRRSPEVARAIDVDWDRVRICPREGRGDAAPSPGDGDAEEEAQLRNDDPKRSDEDFFRVVPDDYVLRKFEP